MNHPTVEGLVKFWVQGLYGNRWRGKFVWAESYEGAEVTARSCYWNAEKWGVHRV